MTQFYAFLVPGGLAVFVAFIGITSFIRQKRRARTAAAREGKGRQAFA